MVDDRPTELIVWCHLSCYHSKFRSCHSLFNSKYASGTPIFLIVMLIGSLFRLFMLQGYRLWLLGQIYLFYWVQVKLLVCMVIGFTSFGFIEIYRVIYLLRTSSSSKLMYRLEEINEPTIRYRKEKEDIICMTWFIRVNDIIIVSKVSVSNIFFP